MTFLHNCTNLHPSQCPFHEYFTIVIKSLKAWKAISLSKMLCFSWGQSLPQWLLKKAHCSLISNDFLTVERKKRCLNGLSCMAAYGIWILYAQLIEWVSVYLFVFFCLSLLLSDLGQSIFYTTTCLLPFLSDDILSTLPYTMISTLATFPPFLHKDIIEYLSTSFLPMAICEYDLFLQHVCYLLVSTVKVQ